MNVNYEDIKGVNERLTYTMIHNKNYAEVAQKIQGFRSILPGGFILPEIIKHENGVVYMKAEAGYYAEDGRKVVLAVGHAFERQDASNINKTSYIENCETSAIGRALSFIGIGSEQGVASTEEVNHAIETQKAIEEGRLADPTTPAQQQQPKQNQNNQQKQQNKQEEPGQNQTPPAFTPPPSAQNVSVSTSRTLPGAEPPQSAVLTYLAKERKNLKDARGISEAENTELWSQQVAILKQAGLTPAKALSTYTMQEAEALVRMMYERFTPTGTELKPDDRETA